MRNFVLEDGARNFVLQVHFFSGGKHFGAFGGAFGFALNQSTGLLES